MRSIMTVAGLAFLTGGAALVGIAGQNDVTEATPVAVAEDAGIMRAKLASTQKIVEGLLAKDFALIRSGGEELDRVGRHAAWPADADPVYTHHRNELLRQAAKVSRLGEERNLDGASYAYMHLLTTCISCHSYCRDVLHVATELPQLTPPPRSSDVPLAPLPGR